MTSIYAASSAIYSLISWLASNVVVVLQLIGMWFTFRKMGLPGWKGIIPYYSTYVLFEKLWDKKMFWRWIIYMIVFTCTMVIGSLMIMFGGIFLASGSADAAGIVLLIIGILFLIASLVMMILAMVINYQLYKRLAHAFGLKDAWAWGLLFLPYVFLPIIGFHKRIVYYGPVNHV